MGFIRGRGRGRDSDEVACNRIERPGAGAHSFGGFFSRKCLPAIARPAHVPSLAENQAALVLHPTLIQYLIPHIVGVATFPWYR